LCHLGDNLESHTVGGFSTCFSSYDICRQCHQMHSDLSDIAGVPRAKKWTATEYDDICSLIETGQKGMDMHGVRARCVFNVLESFHCVGGFPFDAMHDWHEKVAAGDCQSVILALVMEGKFSLENYNNLLSCFRFKSYESSDRPLPIKATSDKLCGKAMSVCLHVRIMPLLVYELVGDEEGNDVTDLLLLVHQLNELIMSDQLSPGDVLEFESLLVDYFEKRRSCLEQYPTVFQKLTPKAHFLEHYPNQVARFGPMSAVSTARYEGKHREFVGFSDASKNCINITKTISTRHQKRQASRCLAGMFSAPEIQFPPKITSSTDGCLPNHLFQQGRVLIFCVDPAWDLITRAFFCNYIFRHRKPQVD
jgi:hypothetical protein